MKDIKMKKYDENNIFFKILNKEVECKKVQEDDKNLSFEDINKQNKAFDIPCTKAPT